MSLENVPKTTTDFLKKNLTEFEITEKLSHFSDTYLITTNKEQFVVKTLKYRSFGSVVHHDENHVQKLLNVSHLINKLNEIKTVSLVDSSSSEEYSLLLFEKETLSILTLTDADEFKKFGKAVKKFHTATNSIKFQPLPWNNFPKDYISELKRNDRWITVEKFLSKYETFADNKNCVSCHNDIHPGNIFISRGKIIFLDIDDMCSDSYHNDLGMVIANYIDSSYSKKQIRNKIRSLLLGYGETYTELDIASVAVYSLRKLYFTEGYYLFFKKNNNVPVPIVDELRKRQDLMVDFLADLRYIGKSTKICINN